MDYKIIEITTWKELQKELIKYDPLSNNQNNFWCFRGQDNSEWNISSTLERAELHGYENQLLSEFKRYAHLYTDISKTETTIEWFSLMQHHGAPTRLTDWSKSPYVALFFALNNSEINSAYSSLYALDTYPFKFYLRKKYSDLTEYSFFNDETFFVHNRLEESDFQQIFSMKWDEQSKFEPFVIPLEPYHSHSRLSVQQGIFLCQTQLYNRGIEVQFEENLNSALNNLDRDEDAFIKYLIPKSLKPRIISELNYMNINHMTLFPGLDGLSRHIGKKATIFLEMLKSNKITETTKNS